MGNDSMVRRLAVAQRKRLIASILSYMEQAPWYSELTEQECQELREKVLGSIGAYHDFILDVINVGEDDHSRNARALELITQVHASQRRLETDIRGVRGQG